jgi:ubiquinone/menaquinone biosynthesis C-methylase UbiE
MDSEKKTNHAYPFRRTGEEYERLRKQANMWEFSTLRIFQRIGLGACMSCLDLGCGPSDVMRLMGELVGPEGSVTGIDADGNAGRLAIETLRATTDSNFSFIEYDLEAAFELEGQPFDLTFARLLLSHLRDPLAMLRKMYAWTKPGGYIVVQDYDACSRSIYPEFEASDKFEKLVDKVFGGKENNRFASKLPLYFVTAGIGEPDGADVAGVLGSLRQHGEMIRETCQNISQSSVRMGFTTEAESERVIEGLKQAEMSKQYYSVMYPLLIGVWKCKPL